MAVTLGLVFKLFAMSVVAISLVEFSDKVGLLDTATDVFDTVKEAVPGLFNFFVSLKDFFGNMLKILPSPFDSLTSVFLVLLFALFLWKLIKGGG